MEDKPIINPPVPFLGTIYGGFLPDKMVRIQGFAPIGGDRFNINLQCGSSIIPRDDTALCVSVRLLDGYISRSSLQNSVWSDEQRDSAAPLSIKGGLKFEILILCNSAEYKIAVNGQHFCNFSHRIPCNRISHLTIDGDVTIYQISYELVPSVGGPGTIAVEEYDTLLDAAKANEGRDAIPMYPAVPGPYTSPYSFSTTTNFPPPGALPPSYGVTPSSAPLLPHRLMAGRQSTVTIPVNLTPNAQMKRSPTKFCGPCGSAFLVCLMIIVYGIAAYVQGGNGNRYG